MPDIGIRLVVDASGAVQIFDINDRIIEDSARVETAYRRVRRSQEEANRATRDHRTSTQELASAYTRVGRDAENFNRTVRDQTGTVREQGSMFDRINERIFRYRMALITVMVALYALQRIIEAAWNFTYQGAQINEQIAAMDRLAARYGTTADSMINNLRRVSDATISNAEIVQSAGKAMVMGIAPDTLVTLMEVATAAARTMGKTAKEMFADITLGTARMSKKILDNIGIIVDWRAAYASYALQIGVTVGMLDEEDKMIARTNAIKEAGIRIINTLSTSTVTQREKLDQLVASWQNLFDTLKQGFVDFIIPPSEFEAALRQLDELKKEMGLIPEIGIEKWKEFGEMVLGMIPHFFLVWKMVGKIKDAIMLLPDAIQLLKDKFLDLGLTLPEPIKSFYEAKAKHQKQELRRVQQIVDLERNRIKHQESLAMFSKEISRNLMEFQKIQEKALDVSKVEKLRQGYLKLSETFKKITEKVDFAEAFEDLETVSASMLKQWKMERDKIKEIKDEFPAILILAKYKEVMKEFPQITKRYLGLMKDDLENALKEAGGNVDLVTEAFERYEAELFNVSRISKGLLSQQLELTEANKNSADEQLKVRRDMSEQETILKSRRLANWQDYYKELEKELNTSITKRKKAISELASFEKSVLEAIKDAKKVETELMGEISGLELTEQEKYYESLERLEQQWQEALNIGGKDRLDRLKQYIADAVKFKDVWKGNLEDFFIPASEKAVVERTLERVREARIEMERVLTTQREEIDALSRGISQVQILMENARKKVGVLAEELRTKVNFEINYFLFTLREISQIIAEPEIKLKANDAINLLDEFIEKWDSLETERTLVLNVVKYITTIKDEKKSSDKKETSAVDSFHHGTSYVPRTGIYQLEEGERVIPVNQNKDNRQDNRQIYFNIYQQPWESTSDLTNSLRRALELPGDVR